MESVSESQIKDMTGFRFSPNDREIVSHFIIGKMNGIPIDRVEVISLCKYDPWQLPQLSKEKDDETWYFLYKPEYKYTNNKMINRTTPNGSWKPTGKARAIKLNSDTIGSKRTMVFYKKGISSVERTSWVIHEYEATVQILGQATYFLGKLKYKSKEYTQHGTRVSPLPCNEPILQSPELDDEYIERVFSSLKSISDQDLMEYIYESDGFEDRNKRQRQRRQETTAETFTEFLHPPDMCVALGRMELIDEDTKCKDEKDESSVMTLQVGKEEDLAGKEEYLAGKEKDLMDCKTRRGFVLEMQKTRARKGIDHILNIVVGFLLLVAMIHFV